ncbi:M56 family metallopeptidase [Flagellimonas okinawensis]|uniref:M56 family metallopeptidase n=1 Tax=Flagellimonas okinawensis TaxID=3031324 RepID=A0ABT5XNZ0_9FLAO|nr:M56 family metallopeptidase [[Muricauda] okinawensis]MDF0707614.1 M56 family metallopeptidase [[Muricauda] okinawensis]
MITYLLESLAFQLVFLLAYDLFLKKETFFQWNRVYLLGTFALSLILPWVKIQALQTSMPEPLETTTIFLAQLNGVVLGPGAEETSFLERISWPYLALGAGSILAAIWFAYKLIQIGKLRNRSIVENYKDFTKVTVPKSTSAFSFFRNIFMGDEIKKEKEANILAHELVHVKQWHSLDLLFFELARIVFWFNPLVYIYQNRVAELHEFIADEKAVKQNKAAHFEMLLSEAFQTQNISFVNQFFNKSLIKKRIVMLQKKKSKAVWQLKYVLLLPMVLGMLVYTSCESETESKTDKIGVVPDKKQVNVDDDGENNIVTLKVGDLGALTEDEKYKRAQLLEELRSNKEVSTLEIVDSKNIKLRMTVNMDESIINEDAISIPFAVIDEVPIFPGCEDATDKKACFQEKMQAHIRKNFHYPELAQEQGIQGRVSSILIIDTEGNVVDIRMRGPHELLERETERILSKLPQMQPGKHEGETVKVPFSIPITFRLQGNDDEELNKEIQNFGKRGENWVPFTAIDEAPIFPGCENASDKRACFLENVQRHVRKHFRYPEEAQEQGIQGRVAIMFGISADGDIVDIKSKGPSPILEAEAHRIIARLPKMEPARQEGKPADVIFSIPITFKLK